MKRRFYITIALFLFLIASAATSYATDMCHEFVQKGDYDSAIAACTRQINGEDPITDLSIPYNNRGFAYGSKGQYDRAIEDFSKSISINPNEAKAFKNRGFAYYLKAQYDRAIEDYSKSISINPNYVKAFINRGDAYYLKAQYDQAIADCNKSIELNPKYEYAYLLLLNATWLSKGDDAEAIGRLRRYVSQNGSEEWVRTISRYYLGEGGLSEESVLEEAKKGKDDEDVRGRLCEAYYYLGVKRLAKGNRQGAADYFTKSVETDKKAFREYASAKAMLDQMKKGKGVQ